MAVSLFGGGTAFAQKLGQLNCTEANRYVEEQRDAWRSVWADMQVDSLLAEAVVYPELIRYSYWQDKIEQRIATSSYMLQGSAGADFSVGHFQMKASFVESLEKRWMRCPLSRQLEIYFDTGQNQMSRKARMARLTSPFWQSVYLALFLRLLYIDFPELSAQAPQEQVRLCATAYNHGVTWPTTAGSGNLDLLYRWSSATTYHTDFIPTSSTTFYSYADLAAEYYAIISKL
ncbi:MAG: hypothetical protein Q4B58_07625 [Bacteroidales bacterium]|nr:hypothetical protein [Bacteroidales bacterium]